ncbi:MAG: helix-turn-helix transcriptional regulator [Dysosmobacter sp.]|nr:helix-turn-helix transcriptional regulator [Dysosmobacter sp.]
MIANHLSRILGEKRWSQARLARITGIRAATINELYNDFAARITLENLDRICEALDCDVSDIFEYIPNHQRKTGKDLIAEEHGNRNRTPASRR